MTVSTCCSPSPCTARGTDRSWTGSRHRTELERARADQCSSRLPPFATDIPLIPPNHSPRIGFSFSQSGPSRKPPVACRKEGRGGIVIAMQVSCQDREKRPSIGRALLGWVCTLLVVFTVTVHLVHSHPDGAMHSDCVFCHAAHVTAQPSAQQAPVCVEHPDSKIVVAAQPVSRRRLFTFSFWNRPPPFTAQAS